MLTAVPRWSTWATWVLFGLLSCSREPNVEQLDRRATKPLADPSIVEVEGCALRQGKTCVLPPASPAVCEGRKGAPLQIWLPNASNLRHASLEVDGGAPRQPKPRGDGLVWALDDVQGRHDIVMRDDHARVWSLKVRAAAHEPDELRDAREVLGKRSDPARAIEALDHALADYSTTTRLAALDVLTDLLLRELRQAADERDVLAQKIDSRSQQAYDLALEIGDVAHASCHARRALHTALSFGDTSSPWWSRLEALDVPPAIEARNRYYLGLAARRSGELQAALDAFERVEVLEAERGRGGQQLAALATEQRAVMLANLGQHARALEMLDALEAATKTKNCGNGLNARNNRAWLSLLLREQGVQVEDPLPRLQQTLAALRADHGECYDAPLEIHVLINMGIAAVEQGQHDQAAALLEELRGRRDMTSTDTLWTELLALQLDAANPSEHEGHAHDDALDAAALRPDERWRLAYWRGRREEARGRSEAAIASYRDAEASLSALTSSVRFDAGRDGLLLGRQPSAGRLVDLLLERGEQDEALCVARLARGRTDHLIARTSRIDALPPPRRAAWREARSRAEQQAATLDELRASLATRPLDARAAHEAKIADAQREAQKASREAFAVLYGDATRVPTDDCASLRPTTTSTWSLLPFPIDRDSERWAVFSFDSSSTQASIVPRTSWSQADNEAVSKALLGPFESQIAAAKEIRILPTGDTWDMPFAALPWHGAPLLAHAPIVFSLDLPTSPPARDEASKHALVIGDPNGNLAHAREEADLVRERLETHAWTVEHLVGAQARIDPIREALRTSSLIHFAGHGLHAGDEGWSSRLQLAGDQWLTVHDILQLDAVPSVAILPACEVANTARGTLGGGMSIARGLLLAGSQVVIAGRGPVDDARAKDLASMLYAKGIPTQAPEAAQALQRASLKHNDEGDPEMLTRVIALVP